MEPYTVKIEVREDLIRYGELTIWIQSPRGRYWDLGVVEPGEAAAFWFQVRYSGRYTLLALQESGQVANIAGRPHGEPVATSESFQIPPDTRLVAWNISSDVVRLDRAP